MRILRKETVYFKELETDQDQEYVNDWINDQMDQGIWIDAVHDLGDEIVVMLSRETILMIGVGENE